MKFRDSTEQHASLIHELVEELESVLLLPNVDLLSEMSVARPELLGDVELEPGLVQVPEDVLQLVEDALLVPLSVGVHGVDGEDLVADAGGEEELLQHRVHVTRGARVLQADERASPLHRRLVFEFGDQRLCVIGKCRGRSSVKVLKVYHSTPFHTCTKPLRVILKQNKSKKVRHKPRPITIEFHDQHTCG